MNVLIVKTSAIGDVIQSFDALEYLKDRFPNATVDWVVSPPALELVSAHPLVTRVICADIKGFITKFNLKKLKNFFRDLRSQPYDILFDLQGNIKSGLISSFCLAKHKVGFGPKSVAEWPNLLTTSFQYEFRKDLDIREQYIQLLKKYFNDDKCFLPKKRILNIDQIQKEKVDLILKEIKLNDSLKILICPSSRWKSKMLPSDILNDFLRKIAEKKKVFYLLLSGNEDEKEISDLVHQSFEKNSLVLDFLELPTLQNLISRLDFVISMDSFALHLAKTAGISSFGIFGPSSSSIYMPKNEGSLAYQGQCPFNQRIEKRCPNLRSCKKPKCMQEITSNKLLESLSSIELFK